MVRKNQGNLIKLLQEKYNNIYEYYPDVIFTGINNKLKGKCLIHNIEFETTYNKHNKYSPCKECFREKSSKSHTQTLEEILNRIKSIYGDKYNLSLIKEYTYGDELKIICPIHGISSVSYEYFIHKKRGCRKCIVDNFKTKYSPEDIYNIFSKLKPKYDYSEILKLDKVNTINKLPIICFKHGLFYQSYHSHLKGQECPRCNNKKQTIEDKIGKLDIINYEYFLQENTKGKDLIKIRCRKHDITFYQKYNDHQQGHTGCSKCNKSSPINEDLKKFIEGLNVEAVYDKRNILKSTKQLDIYIPELKLAIEYNGIYWHSHEILKNKNYHLNKTEECFINNIDLFHVWENDWKCSYKQNIIKSMILNKLNLTSNKIYARKCEIREVSNLECSTFLNNNHLQGKINSKIKLGLYFENKLVSLMTFGSLRKSLGKSNKQNHYELLRFCNIINTNVVGGASKLFKYFIKNFNPEYILSYANRDYSNGNLYNNLGMNFVCKTGPSYWYINNSTKYNRFSMRKDILVSKYGGDPNLTENILVHQIFPHIKTIYNSGNLKFEWNSKII